MATKITVDDVLTGLRSGTLKLTREQIKEIWDLLRAHAAEIDRKSAFNFQPGDTVSFVHKGQKKTGKVMKVNLKSVTVRVMTQRLFANSATGQPPGEHPVDWKVTASLLTKEP